MRPSCFHLCSVAVIWLKRFTKIIRKFGIICFYNKSPCFFPNVTQRSLFSSSYLYLNVHCSFFSFLFFDDRITLTRIVIGLLSYCYSFSKYLNPQFPLCFSSPHKVFGKILDQFSKFSMSMASTLTTPDRCHKLSRFQFRYNYTVSLTSYNSLCLQLNQWM